MSTATLTQPALSRQSQANQPAGFSSERSIRASLAAKASRANGKRRGIDPATCDRDYSSDEVEFLKAIQDYKQRSGRTFPTWSEVLEVVRDLGYRKLATEAVQ